MSGKGLLRRRGLNTGGGDDAVDRRMTSIAAGLNAERHVPGDIDLAGQTTEVASAEESVEPVFWVIGALFDLNSAGGAVALSVTVDVLGQPSVWRQTMFTQHRPERSAVLHIEFVPFSTVVHSDGMCCTGNAALGGIAPGPFIGGRRFRGHVVFRGRGHGDGSPFDSTADADTAPTDSRGRFPEPQSVHEPITRPPPS